MGLRSQYPLYVANVAEQPNTDLVVTDKFTGQPATRVAMADAATIDRAIAAAVAAAAPMAAMASFERQAVLAHCVTRFTERADELAHALCIEAGKPIRDSRGEVGRLIDTFRIAAEESVRLTGEVQPLDISARARGYQGMWKRVPIGPCSFISPFNFPLNLAAHKIAPAIAVGCPFVMKPASRTPLGAIIIGEVLAETALPPGAFSILPAHREGADLFTTAEAVELHRFARCRLGSEGAGGQEEGGAGTGWQCGGGDHARCRSGRRGGAHGVWRLLPVRPVLHRRAAHSGA
jgi:acyl-CoA reductase-like NAD-dependent aldehyde dehydrogenase